MKLQKFFVFYTTKCKRKILTFKFKKQMSLIILRRLCCQRDIIIYWSQWIVISFSPPYLLATFSYPKIFLKMKKKFPFNIKCFLHQFLSRSRQKAMKKNCKKISFILFLFKVKFPYVLCFFFFITQSNEYSVFSFLMSYFSLHLFIPFRCKLSHLSDFKL